MFIIDWLWNIFRLGYAPKIMIIAVCSVSYVFCVTIFVCFFSLDLCCKEKKFFSLILDVGVLVCMGCFALDYLSAKTSTPFVWVCALIGCLLLFGIENTLLNLQKSVGRCIKVSIERKKRRQVVSGVSCVQEKPITPVKREKNGSIIEVPLRAVEKRRMDSVNLRCNLSERYLTDCIDRLKKQRLTEEDARSLSVIEGNLVRPLKVDSPEQKKIISENCGRLITLLAKYF